MNASRPVISAQIPQDRADEIDRLSASEGVVRSVVIRALIEAGLANPSQLSALIARYRLEAEDIEASREPTEPRKVLVTDTHQRAVDALREEKGWNVADSANYLLDIGIWRYKANGLVPDFSPPTVLRTVYARFPDNWMDQLNEASKASGTSRAAMIRHLLTEGFDRPDGEDVGEHPVAEGDPAKWPECASQIPVELLNKLRAVAEGQSIASVVRRLVGEGLYRNRGGKINIKVEDQLLYNLPLRLTPTGTERIQQIARPYGVSFSAAVRWLLDVAIV